MLYDAKVRMAVIQARPEPQSLRKNLSQHLADIARAKQLGALMVFLPELATTGYLIGDRWEHDAFIRDVEKVNERLREASDGIVLVFGSVKADWNKIGEDGRVRKYNAAFIAQNGKWVSNGVLNGWVPKTNMPKYRIFDDARHFYPGDKLAIEMHIPLSSLLRAFEVDISGKSFRIALTICEDLWEDEYHDKISKIYGAQDVDLLVDISASPWTAGKYHARDRMLQNRARDAKCPILYVNRVGLENNTKNLILYDGDSALIGADGKFKWRGPQHEAGVFTFDFVKDMSNLESNHHKSGAEELHAALIVAIRAFLGKFPKIIIGLSGGIDSAVSAALLVEALGADKVLALNMSSKFNSKTTQSLAEECANSLGIEYRPFSIQAIVNLRVQMLVDAGFSMPDKKAMENAYARERGCGFQALVAQMFGGVFINNGNKTEVALNYFTLYGDGAGVACFLADLWKGQIYELAAYINKKAGREVIPEGIINIIPSAELSEDHNIDQGKGDPIHFPYHDKLLLAFTERRWDPTTVMGYMLDGDLEETLGCRPGVIKEYFQNRAHFVENLEWAWRQYNIEFKRGQTPPVFLTSRRAFGFDRRDTIAEAYFTDEYAKLKSRYLELNDL